MSESERATDRQMGPEREMVGSGSAADETIGSGEFKDAFGEEIAATLDLET